MVIDGRAACTGAVDKLRPCYDGTMTGPVGFNQASGGGLGITAQHAQPKVNLAQDLKSLNLNLDRKCTVCMTVYAMYIYICLCTVMHMVFMYTRQQQLTAACTSNEMKLIRLPSHLHT